MRRRNQNSLIALFLVMLAAVLPAFAQPQPGPALKSPEVLPDHALKLCWIGAGDNDQTIGDGAKRLDQTLTRRNIKHEYHESTGGHTWINWRLYLRDFAQRLFR